MKSGRMSREIAAIRAFMEKWKQVEPAVNSAFVMQHIHGMPYTGPTLADEIKEFEAILSASDDAGK